MVGQKAMTFGPSAKRLVGPDAARARSAPIARRRARRGQRRPDVDRPADPRPRDRPDLLRAVQPQAARRACTQAQAVAGPARAGRRQARRHARGHGPRRPRPGRRLRRRRRTCCCSCSRSTSRPRCSAWLQGYVLNDVVQNTVRRMRSDVEDKINRLPLGYFDRQPRGELLSRVTNDIDNVSQTLQQTMSQLLTSLLTVVAVLAMMFWISPLLALIALVSVPISMLRHPGDHEALAGPVHRAVAPYRPAQRAHRGDLLRPRAGQGLRPPGARSSRPSPRRTTSSTRRQLRRPVRVSGLIMPTMMFIGNLNYVVIAVVGGLRVASGTLSLGDVQAFIQYSRQFTQPLTPVASMMNLLQSGVASAERVFELLDADEEPAEPHRPARPPYGRGEVAFEHVSFRYDHDRPLIEDLSLVAQPRADGRDRRTDRRRQDHAGQPGDAVLRARRRPDHPRRRRHHRDAARGAARPDRHGAAGHLAVRGHDPRQHRLRPARTPPRRRSSRPRGRRSSTGSCTRCPTATTRSSTRRARNLSAGERQLVTIARAFLDRPGAADPRRGHLVGRHPHRAAAPARDGRAAHRPDVVRDRPPALHDPRRRPDPGDGGRRDRRAGHPRRRCWPPTAPTRGSTTRSSPPLWLS